MIVPCGPFSNGNESIYQGLDAIFASGGEPFPSMVSDAISFFSSDLPALMSWRPTAVVLIL
jgi:hypothetical protein